LIAKNWSLKSYFLIVDVKTSYIVTSKKSLDVILLKGWLSCVYKCNYI